MLAWLARRTGDELALGASGCFLGAAMLHALAVEAPPQALVFGVESLSEASVALVACGLAAFACAASAGRPGLAGRALVQRSGLAAVPGLGGDRDRVPARHGRDDPARPAGPPAGTGAGQRALGPRRVVRPARGAAPRRARASDRSAHAAARDRGEGVPVRPLHARLRLPGAVVPGARRAAAGRVVRVPAAATDAAARPARGRTWHSADPSQYKPKEEYDDERSHSTHGRDHQGEGLASCSTAPSIRARRSTTAISGSSSICRA